MGVRSSIPPAISPPISLCHPALRIVAACTPMAICFFSTWLGSRFALVLAVSVSTLILVFPPGRSGPRWLAWAWSALALLPLLALLPIPASAFPAWRVALAEDLGLDLGGLITPQPAALLAALVPFWTGLAYFWWACGQQWDALDSKVLVRLLLFAIAGIAAVVVLGKIFHSGPLPGVLAGENAVLATRNQLATILAIGVSVGMTIAFSRRPGGPLIATAGGACASLLCTIALALLGSRAGWLVAAAGLAASMTVIGFLRRSATPVITAVILLVVGAGAILVTPGETGDRIRHSLAGNANDAYRLDVQHDALGLIAEHPWTGHGLGSFDGVFPFYRQYSRGAFRAMHPESDLLWLAGEAGLLIVVLALVATVAMGREWWRLARCDPSRRESVAAAFGAITIILVHGLLDVPAHSMLTWLFAAAIAGTAFGSEAAALAPHRTRATPFLAATLLVAIAVAAWALLPDKRPRPFAHDTPLSDIPDRSSIDAWLRNHPLDWEIVELRAHRALADGRIDDAARDFALVERLEPFNPAVIERSLGAWMIARRAREVADASVRFLQRIPGTERPSRVPILTERAARWPEAARALATMDPPLAWQLRSLDLPDRLRLTTLARLASILAAHGETGDACRIVIFQIGPELGEEAFPSLRDFTHPWPEHITAHSEDVEALGTWYEIAVHQYRSQDTVGAWRILHTYLLIKIPPP